MKHLKYSYALLSLFLCLLMTLTSVQAEVKIKYYPSYSEALQHAKVMHSERIYQLEFNENDLWNRITLELQMPHYAKVAEVQDQINWFKQNKKFLDRTIEQGAPYLFYIYTEVEKRNLPGELILLPMIESAYDPFAHSWVGAAGLWQFMPQTANDYGIKQNWWYDGRRDVKRSTEAALSHLNNLHKYFKGNWLLAIASYNCGAGAVQRAIETNAKQGKNTDFWNLPLPEQTKQYVPRLLALSAIIADPHNYGIALPILQAEPYFAEVDVGRQIDLSKAAKMANITLNHLYQLNPGYSRWTTAPDGPHTLLLPVTKISYFEDNIKKSTGKSLKKVTYVDKPKKTVTQYKKPVIHQAKAPAVTPSKITTYTVKAGDTLWSIADNHQIKVEDIRKWNDLNTDYRLTIGNQLLIQQNKVSSTFAQKNMPEQKSKKITVAQLKQSKEIQLVSNQSLNDAMMMPLINKPVMQEKTNHTTSQGKLIPTALYKVQHGDTLLSIARKFNLHAITIKQANALSTNMLQVGQTLYIPSPTRLSDAAMVPEKVNHHQYTVKKGDLLSTIALNHHVALKDLLKWNDLSAESVIHPGQRLKIRI